MNWPNWNRSAKRNMENCRWLQSAKSPALRRIYSKNLAIGSYSEIIAKNRTKQTLLNTKITMNLQTTQNLSSTHVRTYASCKLRMSSNLQEGPQLAKKNSTNPQDLSTQVKMSALRKGWNSHSTHNRTHSRKSDNATRKRKTTNPK